MSVGCRRVIAYLSTTNKPILTQCVCAHIVYSCVNNRCHLILPLTAPPIVSSLCVCNTHTHTPCAGAVITASAQPVTPHLPFSSLFPQCSSLISPLHSSPFSTYCLLTLFLALVFSIHGTAPKYKQVVAPPHQTINQSS